MKWTCLLCFYLYTQFTFFSDAALVGFTYNISAVVVYGTISPSGTTSKLSSLTNFREFNADQHAYNILNNAITFIALNADEESPYYITVDAQKGAVINKFAVPFGPAPFGLHYDNGILYGQTFSPIDSAFSFVTLNANSGAVLSSSKFPATANYSYVTSTFDHTAKYYISSYLKANCTTTVAQEIIISDVTQTNRFIVKDIILQDNTSPITNFHYNNYTRFVYGFLRNPTTDVVDVVTVDYNTGKPNFLNIFNNTKYKDDIRSTALDAKTNMLYVIFMVDEVPRLVTIDLTKKVILTDVVMKGVPLIDMLTVV